MRRNQSRLDENLAALWLMCFIQWKHLQITNVLCHNLGNVASISQEKKKQKKKASV